MAKNRSMRQQILITFLLLLSATSSRAAATTDSIPVAPADVESQDAIIAAVDLLTGLPVHIYTITQDAVEGGIVWLYKRP